MGSLLKEKHKYDPKSNVGLCPASAGLYKSLSSFKLMICRAVKSVSCQCWFSRMSSQKAV